MYALKRRQKKFHNSHVMTKEFKLGDLVLIYTLKQFQLKFTKRGRGPYVISQLSSTSGSVKLSTLGGEEMLNWISGCRIKKFHVPLTQEELDRLHKAKWRQQKRKLVAEMAQEEAKERARKRKNGGVVPLAYGISKRHKFSILEIENDEETPQPFIAVQIGNERKRTYAFIDSGADGNTISYELFKELGNIELKETKAVFKSYTGHMNNAHGVCDLTLFVSELMCGDKFYVTQVKMQDVPIILWTHMAKKVQLLLQLGEKISSLSKHGQQTVDTSLTTR